MLFFSICFKADFNPADCRFNVILSCEYVLADSCKLVSNMKIMVNFISSKILKMPLLFKKSMRSIFFIYLYLG